MVDETNTEIKTEEKSEVIISKSKQKKLEFYLKTTKLIYPSYMRNKNGAKVPYRPLDLYRKSVVDLSKILENKEKLKFFIIALTDYLPNIPNYERKLKSKMRYLLETAMYFNAQSKV